ncbi:MAG: c-type cytochrome [Acidimicrobiia bacterium]|nr:c-type cytochrome [Acidimicrobiia bacterium]
MRRSLVVAILVGVAMVSLSGSAAAADLIIDVSGPEEAVAGEELEIIATVRDAVSGGPVEGVPLVFSSNAFFGGVTGEIRLGAVVSNNLGVATYTTAFTVRGIHQVRVEIEDDPETERAAVTIGVDIGSQIVGAEAGISIPGLGSWFITAVIAAVWVIMIVAALWLVRVSRSGRDDARADEEEGPPRGRRRRAFNLAPIVVGVMTVLALGLVAVLMRSPDTHHNFDPEGYDRSPVAYLDAAYVYPGLGLADIGSLTGEAVGDGRTLFLKLGCAGCHGLNAQGGASAGSPAFATRQWLGTVARTGLPGGMPAYSEADLSDAELDAIHAFLLDARDVLADESDRDDADAAATTTTEAEAASTTTMASGGEQAAPSFAEVQEILQADCSACHGAFGGWSAADYDSVVESGDNGPAVIPGDADNSLLAQKLLGTQSSGSVMPPGGSLADSDIQVIIDWIEAGATP